MLISVEETGKNKLQSIQEIMFDSPVLTYFSVGALL
jgi:hypothetical protein